MFRRARREVRGARLGVRGARRRTPSSKSAPSTSVRFAVIAASILIVFLVTYGTYLTSNTVVEKIEVEGSYHATVKSVVNLSGVRPGDTLFALDTNLIRDRITRHQWIEETSVTRWLTGTLSIRVKERRPVTLVVSRHGQPVCYLDRDGVILDIDTLAYYNVPLLRGLDEFLLNASRIEDPDTVELLRTLASLDRRSDALVSDVVLVGTDGFEILTAPLTKTNSIRVKLGRGDYRKKFAKLEAFWDQALLVLPEKNIEWIDLRFAGQVITKET